MSELYKKDLSELSQIIKKKEASPLEITEAFLDRIEKKNESLNAFVTLTADSAIDNAKKATESLVTNEQVGPLFGLPIAHKDLYNTKGVLTTGGSALLKDNYPDNDATVVAMLKEAGMVTLGKVNTHEFAYGPTGEFSVFGPTRNPWNLDRVAGGSSSGSAAAVAGGLAPVATGSDTGGSIRMPAACCGLTGLKPTYGRVSRAGILPLCWTMDHSGPLARSAIDCALILQACAGHDPKDAASAIEPVPNYSASIESSIKGMRIGLPRRYFFDKAQGQVIRNTEETIKFFKDAGAEIIDVDIEHIEHASAAAMAIYLSEATSYHNDSLGDKRQLFTEPVKGFLQLGDSILAKDYIFAQRYRTLLGESFNKCLNDVDVLLTPGINITAPILGSETVLVDNSEEDVFSTILNNTEPLDLTGLPAIVFPNGFGDDGLPTSVQIIGSAFDEAKILNIVNIFQRETNFHKLRPEF